METTAGNLPGFHGTALRTAAVIGLILLLTAPAAAQQQSWCGIQTLFFQHNASTTPAGYEELINYPSGNPQEDENITIKNTMGPVLLDSYITPENSFISTTELLKGLRRYRMYHYVDGASGVTQANYSVYIRHSNGVEDYVYSALSDDIDSLTPTEYLTSYVKQTDSFFLPTDRIVIKIFGQTTHSSNVVFHFVYQGSVHTSHVESGYFVCSPGPSVQNFVAGGDNPIPASPLIPVMALIAGIAALTISRRKQ